MNYKELNGKSIRAGFVEFHALNPHIYDAFENHVFKAIRKGIKKVSAKLIVNLIRWETIMQTTDENFKINDAYQSYYARLFVGKHPEFKSMFEFRKLRNEECAPFMTVDENGQLSFH